MKTYTYAIDTNSNTNAARILRLIGQGKRVLEVGCSTGSQTKLLKNDHNCRVTAVEINPAAAKIAREYCDRIIVGNIEELDLNTHLGSERFDVITFNDVLEHLRDPRTTLEKVRPFLSETGYIVASVPNIAHASVAFELCQGRFDYQPTGLLDDTHIRFFTKRTVTRTFEDAGFIITKLERYEVRPEYTEFKTRASSNEDKTLLDYLLRNNPESLTYQFMIQATPLPNPASCQTTFAFQTATDRIRQLETLLQSNEQLIHKLESEIRWINSRPLAKLYRFFRR